MFLNWVLMSPLFRAVRSILRTYFGKMLFRYVNIGAITLQLRTYMRKSLLRYVNFSLDYACSKCLKLHFTYLKTKNSFQVRKSCDSRFEITYLFRKNALQVRKYRIKSYIVASIVTKTRNAMHSGSVIHLRSAYCQSSFAPQPLQKCESPTVYGRPQFLQ